jgi:methylase of polypeptide subunit release factors
MSFSSINIQGNIISSEILDKIRSEEKFKHQTPEAFGLARSASLRDEIGMAWSIMRTHWQAYKRRLENLPQGDTGTSLTREKLIVPLLTELGYVMGLQKAQLVNGKSYNISHGATNIDNYPIHIMGYNDNLDKRRETGGQKVSPHALVQEYLNNTEHLYALVTNGRHLRLLRDATRLVRMSYLEFDLERMFEEELYADFSMLFRVLHATRMPQQMEAGAEAVIEFYHQESMASGTRIRTKLSEAVEISIKTLANGFLEHPKNSELIELLDTNKLDATTYYTHQLRLIYRILFLIVLEERKLVFPEELNEEQQRFRDIYYKYYSIERLRKLTENKVYIDADKYDLWESLKTTFLLFENQEYGTKIGIKPLGSGLFAPNALGTLKEQFLSNGNLIEVLKRLTTFVNEQGQLVRVNYSDLDVEEFGSVYEGLLEYDPVVTKIEHQYHFSFKLGDDRSSSGSHYTPEELVKPLIKHSLDYIIADKLKETNPEQALLSITVCDVACGSGHILLSAARKIAAELASIREGAEQPSPAYYRGAIRDVIKNCIYGVDLNPLAVELCKVALWLEAHEPGQPMNFLDHHIKCGNAIVGLAHFEELENGIASEAFKTLPGDDKEIATAFRNRNNLERKTKGQLTTFDVANADVDLKDLQKDFINFTQLPENTPEQISKKEKAYQDLTQGKKWFRLKQIADVQVAQFFIPKTEANKEKLTTQSQYISYLKTNAQIIDRGAGMATAQEKHFFHWFLEFPQVFQNGGFDCILGNPPYLGDKKLKRAYGEQFIEYVKQRFTDVGANDLVVYFFNRIHNLINDKSSFMALLSTDSISEGDLRIGALSKLISENSKINFAIKSTPWPGEAKTNISVISFYKGKTLKVKNFIKDKEVNEISSFLIDGVIDPEPFKLINNQDIIYTGYYFLGDGFLLLKNEYEEMINDDIKNNDVIFPCFNGDDLNNLPTLIPHRYIINFFDWSEEIAKKYKKPYERVKSLVKPIRDKTSRVANKEKWWIYAENRPGMRNSIKQVDRFFATAQTTKYLSFREVPYSSAITQSAYVVVTDDYALIGALHSNIHFIWAEKYGNTLGSTFRYTPSKVFDTFPIKISEHLYMLGKSLLTVRDQFLNDFKIGLTTFYNKYHDIKNIDSSVFLIRDIHTKIDIEVLESYGWQDIALRHDFYEVDYLPENDRVRYTIHPEARKEVLKRLLELNHKIHEEEVAAGLWDKKKPVKKEKVVKKKGNLVSEPFEPYNQPELFGEDNLFSEEK